MNNSPSIMETIWPILLSVLSLLVGIIGTLFGVIWKGNKEKQCEQDASIKEIQSAIRLMPEKYVLKEDFTRIVTQIQKEMKDISDKIVLMNNTVVSAINELSVKLAKHGGEDNHD